MLFISLGVFRWQEPCPPMWNIAIAVTLYTVALSAIISGGGNSNDHSNEKCHAKVVGVPEVKYCLSAFAKIIYG